MKSRIILAAIVGVAALAFSFGCNAFSKSSDGTVSVNQATLAADVALVRSVIAAQPAGPKRDQILTSYDAATTIGEVAAVIATAPPIVTATAPPDAQAAAARIKALATTQPAIAPPK